MHALFDRDESTQLTQDQRALIIHCGEHPWNFLSATYNDPRTRHNVPLVRTRDEENIDRSQRIRPFPVDKPHLKALVDLMADPPITQNGRNAPIIIPKARRSIVSYGVCSFALWEWLHYDASNWVIAKHDIGDSSRLMREKIRATYELLPEFYTRTLWAQFTESERGYTSSKGGNIMPAESGFDVGSGLGVAASFFFDEAPLMKKLKRAYEKLVVTAALMVLAGTPPGVDDDYDAESLDFFVSFFQDPDRVEFEEEEDAL
jgi:hypothetical protein